MDDVVLHHHAMILSLALTDLGLERMPTSAVKLSPPIENVDKLQKTISQIDKAIRTSLNLPWLSPTSTPGAHVKRLLRFFSLQSLGTNVKTGNPARNRAQNAFTRMAHSLTYQTRWARNFVSESIVDDNDDDDDHEERPSGARKPVRVEFGQTLLNFAPRAQLPAST